MFRSLKASCGRGPEPWEGAAILWSWSGAPGKDFDLNCAAVVFPEPREGTSILNVYLAVVVRSPGKGRRSCMYILWSSSGAPGRSFDLKCASCGRGPEPPGNLLILHVHLVVVARNLGKGLRS